MFSSLGEPFKQTYYGNILIPAAERDQGEYDYLLDDLKKYDPKDQKHISDKAKFLESIANFYDGKEMVINAFANEIIPLADGSYSQYYERKSSEEPGIYRMENRDRFNQSLKITEKESDDGFNVNFVKKKGKKSKKY